MEIWKCQELLERLQVGGFLFHSRYTRIRGIGGVMGMSAQKLAVTDS